MVSYAAFSFEEYQRGCAGPMKEATKKGKQMKEREVKLVKGESIIFVTLHAVDETGRATESQAAAKKWCCNLGGTGGIHAHDSKSSAYAEYAFRIGELVDRGYTAQLVQS